MSKPSSQPSNSQNAKNVLKLLEKKKYTIYFLGTGSKKKHKHTHSWDQTINITVQIFKRAALLRN